MVSSLPEVKISRRGVKKGQISILIESREIIYHNGLDDVIFPKKLIVRSIEVTGVKISQKGQKRFYRSMSFYFGSEFLILKLKKIYS